MSNFIPNSFQLPNAIIDGGLLSILSHNDIKCYLVVVRKTAGWNKEWDFIPTAQLCDITGIKKRQTVYNCMSNLEELGLIESLKEKGKTTKYRLKVVPSKGTSTDNGNEVVPSKGTSTDNGNEVVPSKGTSSSTAHGYTSKDTTKTTNTKDILFSAWNELAKKHTNLSEIRAITKSRETKIKSRLKDVKDFTTTFILALGKIEKSSYLKGSKGWSVGFDWLIKNDSNILKVIEGNYDDKKQAPKNSNLTLGDKDYRGGKF